MKMLSPAARAWSYGIALAALPLLVAYGIVSEETAPLWAALVGTILVPGLALANVPRGEHARRGEDAGPV